MSAPKTVKQVRFADDTVFKTGNGKAYRARFSKARKSTKKPVFIHPNFQIDHQVETSFRVNFALHYNTCMHLLLLDGVPLREQSKEERHKTIMAYFWEFKEETKISLKIQEKYNRRRPETRKPKKKIQSLLKYCLIKNAMAAWENTKCDELEQLKMIKPENLENPPKNVFANDSFDISFPLKRRGVTIKNSRVSRSSVKS